MPMRRLAVKRYKIFRHIFVKKKFKYISRTYQKRHCNGKSCRFSGQRDLTVYTERHIMIAMFPKDYLVLNKLPWSSITPLVSKKTRIVQWQRQSLKLQVIISLLAASPLASRILTCSSMKFINILCDNNQFFTLLIKRGNFQLKSYSKSQLADAQLAIRGFFEFLDKKRYNPYYTSDTRGS